MGRGATGRSLHELREVGWLLEAEPLGDRGDRHIGQGEESFRLQSESLVGHDLGCSAHRSQTGPVEGSGRIAEAGGPPCHRVGGVEVTFQVEE